MYSAPSGGSTSPFKAGERPARGGEKAGEKPVGDRGAAREIHSIPTMQCRAILFDLDGVLVDSRECIELIWHAWAAERGPDPADVVRVAHGRRIAETLRLVAPRLDASVEAAVLGAMEGVETRGL